jgi:hypothetical protein
MAAETNSFKKAHRSKGKRKGRTGFKIAESSPKFDQQLGKLALSLRKTVMSGAVRAAAKVTRKAIKTNLQAHRSDNTGTGLLQSWALYRKREAREADLYNSIQFRVRSYDGPSPRGVRTLAIVGPSRPWGNHMSLLEFGGNHPLWGSDKRGYQPPRPVMRTAIASSKRAQAAAMYNFIRSRRYDA